MPAQRTRDYRSLEVTTDVPPTPSLSIISPTPRAYTFPINHSVTDSPFSSPSSSPFEPDLRPLAINCTTPPTLIVDTISPTSPATTKSPSPPPPSIQNRRKSSTTEIERRPKKGDEDYVKRPENAFILFRRKCCEDRQQAQAEAADGVTKKQRQADLSKTISQQWKGLSSEERQYWEELAKEKKKEHEQMYPNYVYRPQRSKDKDGRAKAKKVKGVRGEYEHETDAESLSFVLPFPASSSMRRHGRSASAPTPPLPYQSIQLPNVYLPSCPTSPSLLPLIKRRSSHPNHPNGSMSQFDFLPAHNTFMPPSFGQAGEFEASLQSPEYLQNFFNHGVQTAGRHSIPSLHPLCMIQDPAMLLPGSAQIITPPSSIGSSTPPSPDCGPFTPTSAMLPSSFSQLSGSEYGQDSSDCAAGLSQTQVDLELQAELQLQQDLYSSYSWENNSIWPATGGEILLGDDFDLNAIPPIELGLPKFGEEMGAADIASTQGSVDYAQEYAHGMEVAAQYQNVGQNIDGLFGFDEMIPHHGF
jgi:hypothetical protein